MEHPDFSPGYQPHEIDDNHRTSSNNMQIAGIAFQPLSENDQAEIENLFKVN